MTEKRFKVAVYDDKAINGFAVLDLQKPNSSKRLEYENVYIGSKAGCEIVCNFGNSLAEENEQLKQQLKTRVIVNKQYEELQRLKKENEQLKIRLNEEKEKALKFCRNIDTLTIEKEKLKQQRDFYYARLQKIIKIANGDFE